MEECARIERAAHRALRDLHDVRMLDADGGETIFFSYFLTTLIGVGQGLFLALYTGQLYSFFHLGHPERAWRSAAMWPTSWLSREVIVLPAFMGTVFLYGVAHWFNFSLSVIELPGSHHVDITLILGGSCKGDDAIRPPMLKN